MSKKTSRCPVEDHSEPDRPPSLCQADQSLKTAAGGRTKAEAGRGNGEAASSSPESGSLNGDGKRGGKSRRRRKRSSNPESRLEGKAPDAKDGERAANQASRPAERRAAWQALQSERASVWLERGLYERAESLYQCWLASSSKRPAPSVRPPQASGKPPPPRAAPPQPGPACHHGEHVACHHVVQAVWVNKAAFDQAERRFVQESTQHAVPNSLDLPPAPNRSAPSRTPDEGYQSLAPTPATPVVQPAAAGQSVNGLPCIPAELLRDVWLDKPLYDRAEATFYQNLYANNSAKRAGAASRSSEHPQSLVEEEEEEEEDEGVVAEGKQLVVPQGKAEVFHALHPIQEEEEPAEVPEEEAAGVCHLLHPDSERVWLDRWRYDGAESRFYGCRLEKASAARRDGRREAEAPPAASKAPLRDKKMSAVDYLAQEKIWFDKPRYDEAEKRFYERTNGSSPTSQDVGSNSILQDIARARENIQKSLAGLKTTLCNRGSAQPVLSQQSGLSAGGNSTADQGELMCRINSLELENQSLHKVVDSLRAALSKLECRVAVLEKSPAAVTQAPARTVPYTNGTPVQQKPCAPVKEDEDDDDDIDLFGSDDDEEAEKLKEQRLKEYAERKAKKPAIIAKSSILLDVKPWDDETDMAKLEECVRSVQADGLLWGMSKLVPVGYGIKKLQIACVVEDDKVGTDLLEEEITKFEDYVQSVDVAAFNKI